MIWVDILALFFLKLMCLYFIKYMSGSLLKVILPDNFLFFSSPFLANEQLVVTAFDYSLWTCITIYFLLLTDFPCLKGNNEQLLRVQMNKSFLAYHVECLA